MVLFKTKENASFATLKQKSQATALGFNEKKVRQLIKDKDLEGLYI